MINEIETDHILISKDLQDLMDIDSSFLQWAVTLVELLTNLEHKRKNWNKQTKILIMKLILVELFIDTKKQLHIQENELFEYIKIYKKRYGGAKRNWTAVQGVADLCMTTLPWHQKLNCKKDYKKNFKKSKSFLNFSL